MHFPIALLFFFVCVICGEWRMCRQQLIYYAEINTDDLQLFPLLMELALREYWIRFCM
jgi:hypothetical protein